MEIVHLSAECYPVAKVGGLADVVGALPKYQNRLGHIAKVVMPAYDLKFMHENEFEEVYDGWGKLGNRDFSVRILREKTNKLGFDLFLVQIPGLLNRPKVYGYADDLERFFAFQVAALDWIEQWEHKPDVIHCHDYHTGLVPFMMSNCVRYWKLNVVPSVITIHNAEYQGQFGFDKLQYFPSYDPWHSNKLEWAGAINPLASAIKCAWRVSTVSPSYLEELSHKANGLEALLASEKRKSRGILNGIDTEVWDPSTDPMLYKKFNLKTLESGKRANKQGICSVFNLDPDKPLFTFIGRLVGEKGAELLPEIFYHALNTYRGEINILILGSGEADVERRLEELKEGFKGNYNTYIGYNEELSHQIYAGADFLLMPSRVEPCGLNQMYALRFGTVPIVRRIGGLRDTVSDIGDGGFGICHDQTTVWDVGHAIDRAYNLYKNQKALKEIRKFIMKLDHSWDRAAQEYIDMYQI
jgi:starch synthase